jgi:short-subunit dehydrogenase
MVARRQGHISLVSSVAGFRGLPQSLAYGPTKAALIHLAETLYLDLQPQGLGVSVINPGFVDTPLTAGNDFHMPALMSPDEAAQAIVQGWAKGEFEIHFPKRFTRVMKLLRLLPYRLYFALVRRITRL